MSKQTQVWLHGLIAAIIGGGASAVTGSVSASLIAPQQFNFGTELFHTLELMGVMFLFNGLLSMFAYLKQSPIPPEADDPQAPVAK